MSVLTNPTFWQILEESGSINESRGMKQLKFLSKNGNLSTFSKTHSYGEYIFDWSWAEAYRQHRIPYYPKLSSMVPFTPATSPHFLAPEAEWKDLLIQHDEILKTHSSAHFLFTTKSENIFLEENEYFIRDSFQYHFVNDGYRDFDHFLSLLKSRKAKHLRHERHFSDLKIERFTGKELNQDHAHEMYQFYLMTLEEKGAIPYLNKEFYELLFKRMPENVLYVRAMKEEEVFAGALFYHDEKRLYGRYWGSKGYVPNLHFELCYYQGIDFCLERKLEVFEAGAQGEHKIARGFRPVKTTSAHKILHSEFRKAIKDFIHQEKEEVAQTMAALSALLPFQL